MQDVKVILALTLTLFALAGCHKPPEKRVMEVLPAAEVTLAVVEAKVRDLTEDVVGTVRPDTRAMVESRVAGRIERVEVDLGDRVEAGQVLAVIDAREVKARLDRATADRDQAARDLARVKTLLDRQVSSRQEYDAAEARSLSAQAAFKEAEAMLAYIEVRSPFAGVVARRSANPGDFAQSGKTLFEIENPGSLRFEADLPEAIIANVATDQKVQVTIPSLKRTITGTVAEIAPAADSASRTFPVRINLPAVSGLRGGQFGRAAIPVGGQLTMRVPAEALVVRGQMEMVFVKDAGVVRLRLVRSGKAMDGEVEILSGLAAGESIVVGGAASLQDGQPVVVRP